MRPINLLPPESAEQQRSRRILGRIVILGIGYLILLSLLTLLFGGRVRSAEDQLAQQEQVNAQLEQQVAQLSDVQALESEYNANADLIRVALEGEVSWGRVLNDLGRMIPDRVWLEAFSGSAVVEGPTRGTINVSGTGFDVPDVSAWIRALDSDRFPSVAGTWVSAVSAAEIGEYPVANFSSQASLTEEAEADRADDRIPEVNQ